MPHFFYNSRVWRIATDDFACPAIVSMSLRALWTALLVTLLAVVYPHLNEHCSNYGFLWSSLLYFLLSICSFIIGIVCDAKIMTISFRGSLIEIEEREIVRTYVNLRVVIGAVQCAMALWGLVLLSLVDENDCDEELVNYSDLAWAFFSTLVISQVGTVYYFLSNQKLYCYELSTLSPHRYSIVQLLDCFIFLCAGYCFSVSDKFNNRARSNLYSPPEPEGISSVGTSAFVLTFDRDNSHDPPDEQYNVWMKRFRTIVNVCHKSTWCLFGKYTGTEGYDEVASILTHFFHHDGFLDVVPSDVLAGVILVRMEQKERERAQYRQDREVTTDTTEELEDIGVLSTENKKCRTRDSALILERRNTGEEIETNATEFGIHDGTDTGTDAEIETGTQLTPVVREYSHTHALLTASDRSQSNSIRNQRPASAAYIKGRVFANSTAIQDVSLLDTIYRCSVYSMALNTAFGLIYLKPCTGLCRLVCGSCLFAHNPDRPSGCIECDSDASPAPLTTITHTPSNGHSGMLIYTPIYPYIPLYTPIYPYIPLYTPIHPYTPPYTPYIPPIHR